MWNFSSSISLRGLKVKKPRVTNFSQINDKNTGNYTNVLRNKWQQWSGLTHSEGTYLVTQKLQNRTQDEATCKPPPEVSGILQSEISGLLQALYKEFCINLMEVLNAFKTKRRRFKTGRITLSWSSFSRIWMKPKCNLPPKWSARRRSLSWRPRYAEQTSHTRSFCCWKLDAGIEFRYSS